MSMIPRGHPHMADPSGQDVQPVEHWTRTANGEPRLHDHTCRCCRERWICSRPGACTGDRFCGLCEAQDRADFETWCRTRGIATDMPTRVINALEQETR